MKIPVNNGTLHGCVCLFGSIIYASTCSIEPEFDSIMRYSLGISIGSLVSIYAFHEGFKQENNLEKKL
jgi:hypothetical protein